MTDEPITSFRGDYDFLSNCYPARVTWLGLFFPSAEHAYVASKSDNPDVWALVCNIGSDDPTDRLKAGRNAKNYGRNYIALRPNWEQVKLSYMALIVTKKFQDNADLQRRLLETGHRELIEGNNWGDRYWGQCPLGEGKNHLGKILMNVRSHARMGIL